MFYELAMLRRQRDRAHDLYLATMADRGKPEDVDRLLADLRV